MDEKSKRVFILMPFARKFDHLLKLIKVAADHAGAVAERVNEQRYREHIMERIIGQIETADVVVGVLTGDSPNVLYEIGIAHALQKDVVLVINDPKRIPFDLKDCNSIVYGKSEDKFVTELTENLKFLLSQPRVSGSYYQEYKNALAKVEAAALKLAPFFTPIASRYFNEWLKYVRVLVTEGTKMGGPERLEITRLVVHETKIYRLFERLIGDPEAMHSGDWKSFYNEIGGNNEVEKAWILCADLGEARQKRDQVEATWRFLKDRNFRTLYCPPREIERATGEKAPRYDAIEDYGAYLKLLLLPQGGYASGDEANVLVTTFKVAEQEDRRLINSIMGCSQPMDEKWVGELGSEKPAAVTAT
jgi:nucleoside 2-deoxyribosyltransferase